MISAQNYTFTHGTFNSSGGHQATSLYSSTIILGEYAAGEVSSNTYNGYLGFLFPVLDQRPPEITSIDDVPFDQGREVQIVWNRCAFDDVYSINTFYSVWRRDENFIDNISNASETLRMVENLRNGLSENNSLSTLDNTFTEPWKVVEQARIDGGKTYYWQRDDEVWTFIDEVPALHYNEYSYIAPTLLDSSEIALNLSTFIVVYHDLYEYYESDPDSGYSADNIAPDAAENLIISFDEASRSTVLTLNWDDVTQGTYQGNSYPEINGIWYNIYAGNTPDFICDEYTYHSTTQDLGIDIDITGYDQMFFKIVVSDKPITVND